MKHVLLFILALTALHPRSNGADHKLPLKVTLHVPKGETVDVIAKYDDFASNTNPFMFHCHFLQHEDGGMMGQFVVVNNAVEDLAITALALFPVLLHAESLPRFFGAKPGALTKAKERLAAGDEDLTPALKKLLRDADKEMRQTLPIRCRSCGQALRQMGR